LDHGADPNAVGLVEEDSSDESDEEDSSDGVADPEVFPASSLYAACFCQPELRFSPLPREVTLATEDSVKIVRLLLQSGARIDSLTFGHLCLRAPRQNFGLYAGIVPSNAKPLQKLFLKHYTILVRLHAIGTPSTRRAPDRWRLAARDVAPLIASFLSPAPPRAALAFWAREGEESEFKDNSMYM
jgi:hypothetical protein